MDQIMIYDDINFYTLDARFGNKDMICLVYKACNKRTTNGATISGEKNNDEEKKGSLSALLGIHITVRKDNNLRQAGYRREE